MRRKDKGTGFKKVLLVTVACGLLWAGCSSGSGNGGSDNLLDISGTLVGTGSSLQLSPLYPLQSTNTVPLENYSLYCVTFEDNPVAGKGTADNTGNFQITGFDAAGKPFGCFVLDENDNHVADLIFQGEGSSISGNNTASGSIILTEDADLGTIEVDLDRGIATVNTPNIANTGQTITNPFDFTGTWRMLCVDNAPGYDHPATSPDGPCAPNGMTFYMLRVAFKDHADGVTRYAITLWQSKKAFQSCGGVIGMTQQDIDNDPNSPDVTLLDTQYEGHFNYTTEPMTDPASPTTWENVAGITCTESSSDWPQDWNNDGDTNDACSSITKTAEMHYCYANCSYTDAIRRNENICVEEREYNWMMSPMNFDPANFVWFKHKPTTAFGFDEFIYINDISGSTTFKDHWTDFVGYEDQQTHQWVNHQCNIFQTIQLILVKETDTNLSGDLLMKTVIEPSSPDFQWCKNNQGSQFWPWFREEEVRIRVNLEKIAP